MSFSVCIDAICFLQWLFTLHSAFIVPIEQHVMIMFKYGFFKNYISFRCTTLKFGIFMHYKVITPKSLVTVHHHILDLLHPFHPPPAPFPSGNHWSVRYMYEIVFVLFVHLFCFIFHIWVKSYGVCVFPSGLLNIISSRSILAVTNGNINFMAE